jgi:hypothetical protein
MTSVMLDPDDPTRAVVGGATEEVFGIHVGPAVLQNVHPASQCKGRPCVIHNPSDHHMRSWDLVWRGDKGCFERTCPHGVGHPDPDSAAFLESIGRGYLSTHGCDGCCGEDS